MSESYRGSNPLKQMRSIGALGHLTDAQCLELHTDMRGVQFVFRDGTRSRIDHKAHHMAKWLIERAKEKWPAPNSFLT